MFERSLDRDEIERERLLNRLAQQPPVVPQQPIIRPYTPGPGPTRPVAVPMGGTGGASSGGGVGSNSLSGTPMPQGYQSLSQSQSSGPSYASQQATSQPSPSTTPANPMIPPKPTVQKPDIYPGYTFVNGRGWVSNDAIKENPALGQPYAPGGVLTPPSAMNPGAGQTFNKEKNVWSPFNTNQGQVTPPPGVPPLTTTPGGTTPPKPGQQVLTTDEGYQYTVPSDWGQFRGMMRGMATKNYDARGVYSGGSPGEVGTETALAKIMSHMDPRFNSHEGYVQRLNELEAAMKAAGINYQRGVNGDPDLFLLDGKVVRLLSPDHGGMWQWLDHTGGKGGGGQAGGGAGAGFGLGGADPMAGFINSGGQSLGEGNIQQLLAAIEELGRSDIMKKLLGM